MSTRKRRFTKVLSALAILQASSGLLGYGTKVVEWKESNQPPGTYARKASAVEILKKMCKAGLTFESEALAYTPGGYLGPSKFIG